MPPHPAASGPDGRRSAPLLKRAWFGNYAGLLALIDSSLTCKHHSHKDSHNSSFHGVVREPPELKHYLHSGAIAAVQGVRLPRGTLAWGIHCYDDVRNATTQLLSHQRFKPPAMHSIVHFSEQIRGLSSSVLAF